MCCVIPPASPRGDVGFANGVEQTCLAVVDVAHDGDDGQRAARDFPGFSFSATSCTTSSSKETTVTTPLNASAKAGGGGRVERLVDAGENAAIEKNA